MITEHLLYNSHSSVWPIIFTAANKDKIIIWVSHSVVVNALRCGWEISSSSLSTDNKLDDKFIRNLSKILSRNLLSDTPQVVRWKVCRKLGPYKSSKLNHAPPHPCSSFLWECHSLGWLKLEHLPYSIRPGWCNNWVASTRIAGQLEM